MKRPVAVVLAVGAILGLAIASWLRAHHDPGVTVHEALVAYAASAPDLSRAEAALANQCLVQHGFAAVLIENGRPGPWPFSGASPDHPASSDPGPRSPTDAEAAELFGPLDAPVVSVTDPGGRTVTASNSGCLAEARTFLYGSVRGFLAVSSMRQWLTDRWVDAIAAALGSRNTRATLTAWTECAREHGWPSTVTLADVYDLRAIPLLTEPAAPSEWTDERYCRVASSIMEEIDAELRSAPPTDVPSGAPRRFVRAVRAAEARAAEALSD